MSKKKEKDKQFLDTDVRSMVPLNTGVLKPKFIENTTSITSVLFPQETCEKNIEVHF